jgi:hypothetical protein
VFFPSERSLQLGPVSDIPSKIYCHALALGVGFSHSEKTLVKMMYAMFCRHTISGSSGNKQTHEGHSSLFESMPP